MRKAIALLVIFVLVVLVISGCSFGTAKPVVATLTPTRTPKPTFTSLVKETPTAEATPTATNTPVVVPTDTPTPAPLPTSTPTATNTPIPPLTPTSPPPPPTATSTPTPTPVIYPCTYVQGPEKSTAGKPGEGQPSSIFEGYLLDAVGNKLNNYGVYFDNPNLGTACVVTGDPAPEHRWPSGFWKHEFWAPAGIGVRYYITIKQSCDPGAPALSPREDFLYSNWDTGHHKNIIFRCSF